MEKRVVLFIALLFLIFASSVISADCTWRRLDWGPATVVEGTDVTINIGVQGNTCQGKIVNLVVKEWDHGDTSIDDSVTNNPASVTIGSNSPSEGVWVFAPGNWRAEWRTDTDHAGESNPPEYYIVATLDGQTITTKDPAYVFSNRYLNVTKLYTATCTDSDGGITYEVSGNVQGQFTNGSTYVRNDTCTNSTQLMEWSCSSGIAQASLKNCESCVNGTCPIFDSDEPENSTNQTGQCSDYVEGEIILNFKVNATRNESEALINASNLTFEDIYSNNTWINTSLKSLLVFVPNGNESVWVSFFENKSIVESAELNCIISINQDIQTQALQSVRDTKENFETLKQSILTFQPQHQEELERALGVLEIQQIILDLEKMYNNSNSDDDYLNVINNATSLNVPSKLTIPKVSEGFVFFPQKSSVSLSTIQAIGTGSYEAGKDDNYINAIIRWGQDNIDTRVDFTEIDGLYKDGERPVLRIFEISFTEKTNVDEYFFIIRSLENIKFSANYGQKQSGGYQYVTLGGSLNRISFTTTENVDFSTLPAFISPNLEDLDISDPEPPPKDRISKWWVYLIVLLFVGIFGAVAYVVLQRWYENKYEDYLFKNKNHLFNLVTYINNSRAQGIKDDEISRNLKKSGWDSEQVRYGILKYAGKNTGMPRLPILSGGRPRPLPVPAAPPRPIGNPPRRIPRRFR